MTASVQVVSFPHPDIHWSFFLSEPASVTRDLSKRGTTKGLANSHLRQQLLHLCGFL